MRRATRRAFSRRPRARATAPHAPGQSDPVKARPSFRVRATKFTPERIQQINNLVERGKSREEIAELIGVTVGSLAVTCSKLGISLRRRMVNNGVRLLRPTRPVSRDGSSAHVRIREAPSQPEEEAASSTLKHEVAAAEVGMLYVNRSNLGRARAGAGATQIGTLEPLLHPREAVSDRPCLR